MMYLDYQQIVDIIAEFLKVSLPIGITFGLIQKLVNLFMSSAFGSKNIKL